MIQGLAPFLYTIGGVAVAGAATFAVVEREALFGIEPEKVIELQQESAPVAIEDPAQKTEEVVAEEKPVSPEFDLLRVEKDGSAVIAGHGPGDSEIEILDAEEIIAMTKSGPEGDFAIVLDKPLSPGVHELVIRATPKDGEPILSAEAGIINIPQPETQEEVAVLVTEPGEATRILQNPEPVQEEVEATASESVEVAKVEPEVVVEPEEPEVEIKVEEPVVEKVEEPVVEEVKPAARIAQVLVEAVDVEGGKIFIAGTGEPGFNVNIYIDEALLGSAEVSRHGAFLYEGHKLLEKGRYNVRADMLSGENDTVVSRAEVSLLHEPVVEEPKTVVAEVEPVQVEENEPVQEEVATQEEQPTVVEAVKAVEEIAEAEVIEEVAKVEEVTEVVETEASEELVEAEEVVETAKVEEPAKPEIRTGSSVIIRRGDSLWQVARRNYGAGIRYTTIYQANQDQIRNPDLIYPGQVLKVPDQANTDENSNAG